MSFVEKLDEEGLAFFNAIASKPFGEQAVAFLNAYWKEVSSQSEFIFTVAWERMKRAHMHSQGISLLHKYREGSDVDFDIGLYFYEQLCKFLEAPENSKWIGPEYAMSQPELLTALTRKQELREKVNLIRFLTRILESRAYFSALGRRQLRRSYLHVGVSAVPISKCCQSSRLCPSFDGMIDCFELFV